MHTKRNLWTFQTLYLLQTNQMIKTKLLTSEQTTEYTDEQILAASIKNPENFSEIVARYQGAFMAVAMNVLHNRPEAEDVLQETFTKIYLNAAKFKKQEGASFKSWAYRIAFNTAITHYRKLKRKYERETVLTNEHYENLPDDIYHSDITDAKITAVKLLNTLPKDLRRLVEKFYFEDKSYETIAQEENIPLSMLKMRLFRARRLLKSEGANFV